LGTHAVLASFLCKNGELKIRLLTAKISDPGPRIIRKCEATVKKTRNRLVQNVSNENTNLTKTKKEKERKNEDGMYDRDCARFAGHWHARGISKLFV
jgi:hypothetical protein